MKWCGDLVQEKVARAEVDLLKEYQDYIYKEGERLSKTLRLDTRDGSGNGTAGLCEAKVVPQRYDGYNQGIN